jgi:mono/diheme cytochrome c family protein
MKRVLKWVGYVLGTIVVVLFVAVGVVYALSSAKMRKTYPTAVEAVAIPTDPASIARGKHLVEAVGKCQNCHGDNYSGQKMFDDPMFGSLTSTNLTSGKGGIGATFKDADYVRAIRHGVGTDGKTLYFMPSEAFYYFNDNDLGQIIAYIKSLPSADATVAPKRTIGPIGRTLSLLTPIPLIIAPKVPHTAQRPAIVPEGVTTEYGEYLSKAGGCTSCHGDALSGGDKIDGLVAANLTGGGEVGKWTEADFVKTIRTGVNPAGRILSATMPWPYAKNMTDDELRATWMYIHSRPAKQLGEK